MNNKYLYQQLLEKTEDTDPNYWVYKRELERIKRLEAQHEKERLEREMPYIMRNAKKEETVEEVETEETVEKPKRGRKKKTVEGEE